MLTAVKNKLYLLKKTNNLGFLIIAIFILLYSFLPICISEKFVFPNQIQVVVIMAYLSVIISLYLFYKAIFQIQNAQILISKIDFPVLIYIIFNTLSYLFHYQNTQPEVVFESYSLIVLYFLFRSINSKFIIYLLLIFPVTGVIQLVYGIKNQTYNFAPGYGFSDIIGIFYNTGIFGGFIAIVFVVTFGIIFYLSQSTGFKFGNRFQFYLQFLFALILLSFFSQILSSDSRAAWCACIVGVSCFVGTFYGLFGRLLETPFFKKSTIILLIISTMCIVMYGFYNLRKESADGRILIWKVSSEMIKDKPFFGHGANGFRANYMEYQAAYLKTHSETNYSYLADNNHYAFNEFIRIGVEQGIVGLLIYLIILYQIFFNKKTKNDVVEISIKAALVALIVFGLFSYPMDFFQFNLAFIFFIAVLSTHSISNKHVTVNYHNWTYKSRTIFPKIVSVGFFLAGCIVFSCSIIKIKNYETACKQWNTALKTFDKTGTNSSIYLLKALYFQLKNNGIYLSTYGKVLNLSGQYAMAIPILQRGNKQLSSAVNYIELGKSYNAIGEYENAEKAWTKASFMIPATFTPKYLIVKMYNKIGKTSHAQCLAKNLIRKEVKIRSPALNEMFAEMDSILKKKD